MILICCYLQMNLVLVWLSVTALLLVNQGGVDAKKKSKKGKKSLKKSFENNLV